MERITVNPQIHFGKPVIKGTRVTVQNVLELRNDGLTFDQIIQDYYPELTKDDMAEIMQRSKTHETTGLAARLW